MTTAVQRLTEHARAELAMHFLALSTEDRRLRFGRALAPECITAYVEEIDFDRDAIFAVHDDSRALVGVAHVAFGGDFAELGLSVLPAHRGLGAGSALFERSALHARNRFVRRLFMHCLRENAPIMRIARSFGMDIVTDIGDADAHLALPPATPTSIAGEFVTDRLALCDQVLNAHVAAWTRISAMLFDAMPAPAPRPTDGA